MSERHGSYYQPRAVPCECGSREAYWHGPEEGRREYACDPCWRRRLLLEALRVSALIIHAPHALVFAECVDTVCRQNREAIAEAES